MQTRPCLATLFDSSKQSGKTKSTRSLLIPLLIAILIVPLIGTISLNLPATTHAAAPPADAPDSPANEIAATAPANTAVLTYKSDTFRTGQSSHETLLNTSNVNQNTFGKRMTYPVDGQVYAQPLYMPNLTIGGAPHNVVFVATQHDSLYAFDADQTASTTPLWHDSFINPPSVTTISSSDVSCTDITPEYGITGTPVIDASANVLYVVVNTKEGSNNIYRLHKIDVTTGSEMVGSPVQIQASVPGSGAGSANGTVKFNPTTQLQRGGLLLLNGVVYMDFGSHCDNDPYHGWVMGYDASTLQQTTVYNDTPNGTRAGIWQAGEGIAADSNGNIYAMSGNGTFDLNSGGKDAGDSVIKFSTQSGLSVTDYFTPFNQQCLESADKDLGSGGTLLLPTSNELIGVGKEGRIYVVDRNNLGHYNNPFSDPCSNQSNTSADHVLQELSPGFIGGVWGTPAYWNGSNGEYVYFSGVNDHAKAFKLTNGLLSASPTSQSSQTWGFPAGNPVVSSNGTASGSGILWLTDPSGVLHAYDATNLAKELYNTSQNSARDGLGNSTKFSVPTVANGEVFVGTKSATLVIYGLIGGGLTATRGGITNVTVNLTVKGPADWAHWGLNSATSFDHKSGVTQQISNYSEIGSATVSQYTTPPTSYTWTDGTPTASATKTKTGILVTAVGSGFQITVPADTTVRTLRVYVGVAKAAGLFKATLSDGSATGYANTVQSTSGTNNVVYSITYHAASNGQALTIAFTMKQSFASGGLVSLQAAALQ